MKVTTRTIPRSERKTLSNVQALATLDREIEILRATIKAAQISLGSVDDDFPKTGALLARLTDSLGRALLVQQKLAANNSLILQAQRELDDFLRQWKEVSED